MVPTISPVGADFPARREAFRLLTWVVEVTVSGAVPDVTVEINRPAETLPNTVNFSVKTDVPIPTLPGSL